jgi:hypothetical protein
MKTLEAAGTGGKENNKETPKGRALDLVNMQCQQGVGLQLLFNKTPHNRRNSSTKSTKFDPIIIPSGDAREHKVVGLFNSGFQPSLY